MRTSKDENGFVKLQEVSNETDNIDILGLAVMRRENNKIIETQERHMICYMGNKEEQKGVGFRMKKNWVKGSLEYKGITDRIATVKIKIGEQRNQTLTLIQACALTVMTEDRKI